MRSRSGLRSGAGAGGCGVALARLARLSRLVVGSLLAFAAMAGGGAARAQSERPRLSLAEAVERALGGHPVVEGADASVAAARARVGRARAPLLPQLNVNAFGRADFSNFQPVVIGTPATGQSLSYPFQPSYRYSASLTLDQLIFDSGRTLGQYNAAKANAVQARADADQVRRDLEGQVASAYYDFVGARADVALLEDAVRMAEERLERARTLQKAGLRSELDVRAAEAARASRSLERMRATRRGERAGVTLGLLVQGVAGAVEPAETIEPTPGDGELAVPVAARLLDEAHDRRPDLASARIQIREADSLRKSARGDYFPTVSLSGAFLLTGSDAAVGPFYDLLGVLTVTQPVFSGLATTKAVGEAEARVRAARAQAAATEREVDGDVLTALSQLGEAVQAVTLATTWLASAREQLKTANSRYAGGVATWVEINDAENGVIAAGRELAADRALVRLRRAALALAVGRTLAASNGAGGRR